MYAADDAFVAEVASLPRCQATRHGASDRTHDRAHLHVDFDAFFIAVACLSAPELRTVPAAVVSGRDATSEICSANYPARHFGITSNMFVKTAREKCPDLRVVPVSAHLFAAMTHTAARVHALLVRVTHRIKTVSCDELYLQTVACRIDANGQDRQETSDNDHIGVAGTVSSHDTPGAAVDVDPDAFAPVLRRHIAHVTGGLAVSIGVGHSAVSGGLH